MNGLSGEANILGGVAPLKGVEGFDTEVAKKRLKYISKRIVIEDSLAGVQAAKAAQMRLLEVQMMSEPDAENADATFQILSQRLKQI